MIFFNTRFNGEIEYISEIYSNPNINTKYYADLPLMVTQYTGNKPREWFPYNVVIISPNTYEYENGEFVLDSSGHYERIVTYKEGKVADITYRKI